jgi:hypothetical protein
MKCPKWLLDAMAEGRGVKCWLDKEHTIIGIVTGFDSYDNTGSPYYCDLSNGVICSNVICSNYAEPYTEPEHKFVPFEEVLGRSPEDEPWRIDLFCYFEPAGKYHFFCMRTCHVYCIPYAGNEHLLGTTDSPEA